MDFGTPSAPDVERSDVVSSWSQFGCLWSLVPTCGNCLLLNKLCWSMVRKSTPFTHHVNCFLFMRAAFVVKVGRCAVEFARKGLKPRLAGTPSRIRCKRQGQITGACKFVVHKIDTWEQAQRVLAVKAKCCAKYSTRRNKLSAQQETWLVLR